jgi:hypothetical protein
VGCQPRWHRHRQHHASTRPGAFGNGSCSLALFSGSNADETITVFATGRDPDSGTRTTAFAETNVGVASPVVQYQPTISGNNVTAHQPWPQIVVNGITFAIGNGGYASGGTLATTMQKNTSALGGYYVTYLSTGDAATAIAGASGSPAVELKYNGTTYSAAALAEGQYTFWGYEHLMYKSSRSGVKLTTATSLANQLTNTDATVLLSAMKVSRMADGGLVTQNY